MPVFLGGLARLVADKIYKRVPDAEEEPEGTLYCSGLIAGASILGIFAAMLGFLPGFNADTGLHPSVAWLSGLRWFPQSDLFGMFVLCLLGFLIFRAAANPKPHAPEPPRKESH